MSIDWLFDLDLMVSDLESKYHIWVVLPFGVLITTSLPIMSRYLPDLKVEMMKKYL
jgi:hypothetical protein